MPFIKIHRETQFADALRAYKIFIDGEKRGEIRRNSTEDFFVTEGMHRISLKIDWCGSREIEFSVKSEEIIGFNCGNNTKGFFAFYYISFAPNDYIWLRKR